MSTDSGTATIRVATPADAEPVQAIYAPFCDSSAVTFEESAPAVSDMADRIDSTLEDYPWLVCEHDGEVVGYAYASQLRKRRAYQWTVELSVYVAEDARAGGVGRGLYESLFAVLERQGVCDAYAVTTMRTPKQKRFTSDWGSSGLSTFRRWGTRTASGATWPGGDGRCR